MKLQEVPEAEKDQYNQFVAAEESGSFLQSWEWGQWQAALGRQVVRLKILDDSGQQIGTVQFIKMPIWGKRHYIYAPYGPVLAGGEQLQVAHSAGSGQASEKLKEFLLCLKTKFSHAAFIRIEPKQKISWSENQLVRKSQNIQPGKTLLIDLSKSEEQLLSEMHHKTRYNIKVAQKHGVEIKDEFAISVGHGLFFDEALKLIQETSKRQKFTTFSQGYYRKMADFFALGSKGAVNLHIYKAIFRNQLLGAAFMVDFGSTRTFLFGGSSQFHKNVMAPYLLHWKAMEDAKNLGLKHYDFWGTETSSGETPGFVRFKLGFGGQEKEYGGAYDIVNNKLLYKTYSLGRAINKLRKKISPK
jgi:lipid II:glycine glycyltransferase (peptidoglycan interpeptide bridge formation enzyme)